MSKFSLLLRTRQLVLEHNSGCSQLSGRSLLTSKDIPIQLKFTAAAQRSAQGLREDVCE